MWLEANCSKTTQRITLQYLANEFGGRLVVPETDIEKLGRNFIPPMCDSTVIENMNVHFQTKDLLTATTVSLEHRLSEENDLNSVDIIVGTDHRQGKFRGFMKIIQRNNIGGEIHNYIFKIAHIDCKKDTYEVLKATIADSLNKSMKSVLDENCLLLWKHRLLRNNTEILLFE